MEAEIKAKEFIRERHVKTSGILIKRMDKDKNVLLIKGEDWLKRFRLSLLRRLSLRSTWRRKRSDPTMKVELITPFRSLGFKPIGLILPPLNVHILKTIVNRAAPNIGVKIVDEAIGDKPSFDCNRSRRDAQFYRTNISFTPV